MAKTALFIGGCPAPWHRIETAAPPIKAALESLGLEVRVTGIFHPDGGEAWTGDYSALTTDGLKDVDVLVQHTTGDDRHGADIDALLNFVENGKGLVAIHCAADSFKDDVRFVQLIGGKFRHHPAQLDVTVEIVDTAHPITQGIEDFTVFEELYLFDAFDPAKVHLLALTTSYDDGGKAIPVMWVREQGKGRVCYFSLGHNPAVLASPEWQRLFKNAVEWVLRLR